MSEVDVATQFDADIAALSGKTVEVPEKVEESSTVQAEPIAKVEDSATFDPATLPPLAKAQWDAAQKALDTERRRANDFEKRYAQLHGQVSPLQRELNRLKQVKPPIAQVAPSAKPQQPSAEELRNWQKYRSELPDEAAAIEERIQAAQRDAQGRFQTLPDELAALRKELAELREKELAPRFQTIDQIQQARVEEFEAKQQETVLGKHPDWNEHFRFEYGEDNNPRIVHESPQMTAWLDKQPAIVIQALMSDDPGDCVWAMDLFKESIKVPDQGQVQATQVNQTRQSNLAKRAVTGQQGAGVARVDPATLDTASAFDLEVQRLRQLNK